jgi:hypothetical protein
MVLEKEPRILGHLILLFLPTNSKKLGHLTLESVMFIVSKRFYFQEGKTVLEKELKRWSAEWNVAYVIILEDLINDGLTRHQRNDDRLG